MLSIRRAVGGEAVNVDTVMFTSPVSILASKKKNNPFLLIASSRQNWSEERWLSPAKTETRAKLKTIFVE